MIRTYTVMGDGLSLTTMFERRVVRALRPAGRRRRRAVPGDAASRSGGSRELSGKENLTLAKGDRVVMETSGGGGYARRPGSEADDLCEGRLAAAPRRRLPRVAHLARPTPTSSRCWSIRLPTGRLRLRRRDLRGWRQDTDAFHATAHEMFYVLQRKRPLPLRRWQRPRDRAGRRAGAAARPRACDREYRHRAARLPHGAWCPTKASPK